ncbi:glycosyltransferase family 2 protein [Crocinitomix catalasitica]|uniref:glycosyltransferase family 2 protein n=1 Tax=Crocinitomix catalasitica TaxID=184607 RepID=UPI00048355A2|nr:glycosyltransferase family 2 protein [Crocinitomix catalasitica]
MSTLKKISAVIITYNEEKNIETCLKSLVGIVDEIVVVDSFSTDKTESICLKYGARFIPHKFDGHIEQKNWAREQATCDIVLSLDADEALDETLQKSILSLKVDWQFEGYKMNRLTNYCGKWIRHTGWYPDVKLRLWQKGKGHWTGENPHDEFVLFDKNANIGHLKGDILHYSYHHPDDHDKQIEYFTNIAAKTHVEKGKSTFFMQRYLSAILKFIKCYFIKLGFLDGKEGWIISVKSSYAAYLKYKKINALKKHAK